MGNADELGNENEYMFRHVMIQSAIYNALPFLNREECHFRIVELYESILGYDNQPKILPMLTYHALRTSDKLRKIKYLDEAALSLKTVLSIADTDVEIKANTLRMSKWWSLLAFAQVYLPGLTALKLIGVDWPKTPAEYIKQTKEEATRLVRLWLATVGGRLPTYHRLPEVFREKTDIVLRVLPVFREIPLIANMYINASITIAAKGGVDEFIKALVRKAQVHLCGGETAKFWFFFEQGNTHVTKSETRISRHFFCDGCISYYRGDYEETIMYWERAISNADNVGDHGAGKGDQAIKIYDDQMEAAIGAEDLVTQVIILSNHLHMCSYYLRDTGEVAGHLKKYEHILGILAPYRRLAMLSATLFHIRCGDFENAYAVIEGFAVASEKMLANQIVPLMIFAHSSIGAILLITEWKDADKVKLEATFKNLFTRTKAIWSRVTLPGKFACQLIEAAMLLVVGKKKEAVKVLRNGLSHNTSPKNAGIFAAFHSVVIARFSTNPAERDKYSQAALGLLDKYKLAGFAEWMEGKPYVKMR
ncbi:hypothetical protein BC829DRAFT_399390 [Chytridium lagenaria]|nr:hypothetical protein BC829DRAFT_399390 [Chytridium lagenaria]